MKKKTHNLEIKISLQIYLLTLKYKILHITDDKIKVCFNIKLKNYGRVFIILYV